MCGILGLIQDKPKLKSIDFGIMLDTLSHRGPDGRGIQVLDEGRVLLGHRRLAIIDLSNLAAQPMSNEDGSLWIVYNGEIYNYIALRKELRSSGHSFSSAADTEVVLKAYDNWGDDCVHHLRGIFAFAIWDMDRHRLFMARDPLGVKPFYYARRGDCFAFASQPKAIISAPGWQREADPTAFRDYLAFGYIPYDRCSFSGLAKLPAGHRAAYSDGNFEKEAYWTPTATTGLCDPVAALECQLEDAVSSQLMADVPVGCFLSGGIDSSLLVALSKPHCPDLRTFTVGFDDRASDERSFARRVALHFDTVHTETRLARDSLESRLLELPYFFDEPFDPNGALPFMAVAGLAREHNTVVALGGDGADELFAGYLRYEDFDRPAQLSGARGGVFLRLWRALRQQNLVSPRPLREVDLPRYFGYEGCLDNANCLLTPSSQARVEGSHLDLLRRFAPVGEPAVTGAQMMDLRLYLVDHILCKVDRAAMAYGVEARVPFLDQDLVQTALAIPLAQHFRQGERKALLKSLARRYLPVDVVTTRKKGFSSPVAYWADRRFEVWANGLLTDGALVRLELLRRDWLDVLSRVATGSQRLALRPRWLLLNAELWARRWLLPDLWPGE